MTPPGVVSRTVSTKSTNAEALGEMLDQNHEALVVIAGQRKLCGVVEGEQAARRRRAGVLPAYSC